MHTAQDELLDYLISVLQKQCTLNLPPYTTLAEKKDCLRALMNVWQVQELPQDFLPVQDAYLQEELRQKTVQDAEALTPVRDNLYLWQGDITLLKADAVVNAANRYLLGCFMPLHKCIDNAVHSFAGLQLRIKCHELMQVQGHTEPAGKAKLTPAYNLPSAYVVHTVGPIVRQGVTAGEEKLLCSCYRECLRCAAEAGIKSIAFCCISTGEFCFPNERAAELAVQTVQACQQDFARDMKIIFNVFKNIDYEIYARILGSL